MTATDNPTVAANTTAENAACPAARTRKYRPVNAGVSFTPAAAPTSRPDTHHRLLYTAHMAPEHQEDVDLPVVERAPKGSIQMAIAVHAIAA